MLRGWMEPYLIDPGFTHSRVATSTSCMKKCRAWFLKTFLPPWAGTELALFPLSIGPSCLVNHWMGNFSSWTALVFFPRVSWPGFLLVIKALVRGGAVDLVVVAWGDLLTKLEQNEGRTAEEAANSPARRADPPEAR